MSSSVSITTLMSDASRLSDELVDVLAKISQQNGEAIAGAVIAELPNKLAERCKQTVNSNSKQGSQSNSERAKSPSNDDAAATDHSNGNAANTGLIARDIPDRHKTHRQLRKALIESVMLIFFARNFRPDTDGVVAADVAKELARLGLSEPTGTMRSRISGMRSDGLLTDNAGFGRYVSTKAGFDLAKKAVQRYGFQIALPEPPVT